MFIPLLLVFIIVPINWCNKEIIFHSIYGKWGNFKYLLSFCTVIFIIVTYIACMMVNCISGFMLLVLVFWTFTAIYFILKVCIIFFSNPVFSSSQSIDGTEEKSFTPFMENEAISRNNCSNFFHCYLYHFKMIKFRFLYFFGNLYFFLLFILSSWHLFFRC